MKNMVLFVMVFVFFVPAYLVAQDLKDSISTSSISRQRAAIQGDTLFLSEAGNFEAKAVINRTNSYRASKSLAPLTQSDQLTQSACTKAKDMIERDYWSHNTPEGVEPWEFFKASKYTYHNAGENLAYGQKSADEVVEQWIKSPPHEKNLVGEFTETGICVMFAENYRGGSYILTVAHYGMPK